MLQPTCFGLYQAESETSERVPQRKPGEVHVIRDMSDSSIRYKLFPGLSAYVALKLVTLLVLLLNQ